MSSFTDKIKAGFARARENLPGIVRDYPWSTGVLMAVGGIGALVLRAWLG